MKQLKKRKEENERKGLLKVRIVHFEGGAQQLTATLGRQVIVYFDNVGSVSQRVKAGELRGLAVIDKERSKFISDVPTTVELGYPAMISSSSRGILGPKGIPGPILKKIQDVFLEAMKNPEHIEKMEKAGLAIKPMVGDEYARYLKGIRERAKPLVDIARKDR